MPWENLIDESDLARLLPAAHRRFAAPVREGLVVFLSGLPPRRQTAIMQRQAALPAGTPLSVRLGGLALECPVLHKLGQVIARDRRIEPELREQLSKLESLPPATPMDVIERSIRDELGPLEELGLELSAPALAEASVAVVAPFANREGTISGVFKVLKPGVEERLAEELDLLNDVGEHLDQECDRLGIPELDYQDAFAQVRDKIAWELRLDQEQRHLRAARDVYADDPRVLIPELYEYCTPRVTAMQRVYGRKVTDQAAGHTPRARRIAELISQSLIARPVLSRASEALFHCDPHAGNLFLTSDGRLAILDWSLVGVLGESQRRSIAQLLLGGMMLSADKVSSALASIAERPTNAPAALGRVVDSALNRLSRNGLPSMSWLLQLLDEASTHGGLRVSSDMMLFRKALLTLEGVLHDLGDNGAQQNQALLCEFAKHFAAEWPLRWVSLPASREYATRLSNNDLVEAALSLPWSVSRRLVAAAFDRCGVGPRPPIANPHCPA